MARDDISNPHESLPRKQRPVAPPEINLDSLPSQQSAAQTPYEQPQPQQRPRRKHTVLKIILALVVIYFLINLVLAMMGAAVLGIGLVSCMSSCSDSPIGDTAATTRFISDSTTNERDLATFDALRGCIQSVHDSHARYADSDETSLLSVDDLRAQVAAGKWPGTSAGYGDVTTANNPQLWVRIAELAQDHIEAETGERWDVVDFAYPFPNNGPIPVPATRDENSRVTVLFVCRSGADEGLFATVSYWRWERPARFEDHVAEAREHRAEELAFDQRVRESGLLEGRDFLVDGNQLFVWALADEENSGGKNLTDPQAFIELVNAFAELTDGYTSVSLFAHDTPPALGYSALSYDYPNDREASFVSLEACRAALTSSNGSFYVDYAKGDQLLYGWCSANNPCNEDNLRGTLIPDSQEGYYDSWYAPGEGAAFDEDLLAVVQQSLNAEEGQVIALSKLELKDRGDAILRTWVILERGVMPETSEEFCAASNKLRDDVWEKLAPWVPEDAHSSLYLRIYVLEDGSITKGGEPSSFAELREAAQGDVAAIEEFDFGVALGSYPSCSLWPDDTEPTLYDCVPNEVDGSIARSREWRYD